MRRYSIAFALTLMIGYAIGVAAPPLVAMAQNGSRCFSETGKCVQGAFLAYWEANGGLRQQGLPISDELTEDGRTVQYFERARFELHGGQVLLGLLGSEQYRARYQTPAVQDPVTIADAGSKNTALFTLAGGTYLSRWEAREQGGPGRVGCFHGARLVAEASGIGESLGSGMVEAGGVGKGETFLYGVKPGRYYIDSTSGCAWTISVSQQR